MIMDSVVLYNKFSYSSTFYFILLFRWPRARITAPGEYLSHYSSLSWDEHRARAAMSVDLVLH